MDALPRPLLLSDLHKDVLYEILAYLLTDTTVPNRANLLLVCKAFHEAAGTLLYQNIKAVSLKDWEALFGRTPGSLLTVEGGKGFGQCVKRLRVGCTNNQAELDPPFDYGTLILPNCSDLIIDQDMISYGNNHPDDLPSDEDNPFYEDDPVYRHRDISTFLSKLHPQELTFLRTRPLPGFPLTDITRWTLDPDQFEHIFGLPSPTWPASLETLHFDHLLLSHYVPEHNRSVPCLKDWTIGTVVISLDKSAPEKAARQLWGFVFDVEFGIVGRPIRDVPERSGEGAYAGWGKVEVRVTEKVEEMFRTQFKHWMEKITAPEDKHLLSLIVFVDEDGDESKLID